ncbi:putative transcription factor MYC/MYB, protein RICE SALT SENSITIVE 3 [Dioscorea sansibarensis]
MVGSGAGGGAGGGDPGTRSKEAVGMMALHEALRNVCLNSDWTYSVFWTIRPRPCRGGNGCKVGDDNGSLMLMWEDGFCRTRVAECLEDIDGEDPVRKAFSKMSIQLYNYGEGLMGKVASDKCHKWVFKEPSECEPNISNYWQSSFDALPSEWTDQFASGIQTIAVIQAGHGLLQLGSCKIIPEDLHFVLRMRHMFESLGYQSGFYLSQLFSSTRNTSPSSSTTPLKQMPTRPPPPIFNWSHAPLPATMPLTMPNFPRMTPPNNKEDTHLFLLPHSSEAPMEDMIPDHDADLKWPNGLSFFTALTGRTDDAKLLFGSEGLGNKAAPQQSQEAEDYLGLESNSNKARKMENNKFKRSFTLPARMTSSASSSSLDHHHQQQQQQQASTPHGMEYRGSEAGIYSDIMETFLD